MLLAAHCSWFQSWPFLHYGENQDVVFCHTCVKAFELDRMKTNKNCADAFVSLAISWLAIYLLMNYVCCIKYLTYSLPGYII